mmetsp:Transcript_9662/g.18908  ORF Transcript_9662/g.18908 Transcript_9662/m.18908 type:complete len:566 (-) Transcript_9662:878-2575(-)
MYAALKLLCKLAVGIFFQDVETVGQHNIPASGPVIIAGNHSNQFVDPMLIVTNCVRHVCFLMASSSLKKRVVGFMGRMAKVIPVKRPQDYTVAGKGIISIEGRRVSGVNTDFSNQLHSGDSIKIGKEMKLVASVESDTDATLSEDFSVVKDSPFSIIPKIDHNEVFLKVHEGLRDGKCIGIFPEGGSHDRTELLPLKAGVCLMALGAMVKYHVQVTIICCGLNYYQGHKFRSKALVNFGVPYKIPLTLADLYLKDRRQAVAILLKEIERRLRDVWITAENFDELQLLLTARRLYRSSKEKYTPERKMELNKNFMKAYKYLKAKYGELEDVQEVTKMINNYSAELKKIGIKDFQVRSLSLSRSRMVLYSIYSLFSVVFRLIFVLPSWIFIGILGAFINYSAEKERAKALANSEVKLHGYDVLASFKIVYGLVLIPLCSGLIALLVGLYFGYSEDSFSEGITMAVKFLVLWPVYFYLAISFGDKTWMHAQHLYMRVLSIFNYSKISSLRTKRREAQLALRVVVEKYGPEIFPNFSELKHKRVKDYSQSESLNMLLQENFALMDDLGI